VSSLFDPFSETPAVQQVRLDMDKVGYTVRSSARYAREESGILGELTHRLQAYVLTEKLAGDEFTYTFPATWWQHFKRDHLPTYARWRPVVTTSVTVDIERKLMYPHANIAIRDDRFGAPVVFERLVQR